MKKAVATVILAITAVSAQAEITGNATLASDYRFRGISQTQGSAALQGGIDYAHKSGFYIGNWNSSVSSSVYAQSSGLESDLYGGFKKSIGAVTVDLGLYSYFYPRARTGATPDKYDTNEAYVGVGVGPFSAKVSQSYSDYFGTANSKDTRYYEINFSHPVTKKVSLVAHAGRTDVSNQTVGDYDDFNAGVVFNALGFDFGARYYVNDRMTQSFKTTNTVNGQKNYDNGFALTATKTF